MSSLNLPVTNSENGKSDPLVNTMPSLTGVRERIEAVGKAVAVTLAAVYLTGVLVVTFHLAQYGVLSFSMLRTQYIVAGAFLVVPALLILAYLCDAANDPFRLDDNEPTVVNSRLFSRVVAKRAVRKIFGVFVGLVLISAVVGGLASFVLPGIQDEEMLIHHWKFLLLCTVKVFILAIISRVLVLVLMVAVTDLPRFLTFKHLTKTGVVFGFWLVLFVGTAEYFAQNIYSKIPYEYGGGKPLSIVLLLKGEAATLISQALSKGAVADSKSIPCELVMETPDAYVVVPSGGGVRAIQVKKDAVYGVILNRAQ